MTGGGDFSSFDDLKKLFGGGDDDDAQEASAGVGEDAPDAEDQEPSSGEDGDEEEEGEAGARERIDSRPPGFGPMAHGPPAYRDEDSEEMLLLGSFRVRTVFPEEVLLEVANLPDDPLPSDYEGVEERADLRGERIFTIDGEDAKDFDDAICIKPLADGGVQVSVHIADVSHYVRPGTRLDDEALARATSVYLPDQVVPMLPEELSNGLCSLVPDRPRLAFSVFMDFDREGRRTSYTMTKSVIRSMRRCTYKQVQDLLDGVENESTERIKDLEEDLRLFQAWTTRQQAIRDRKGSLRMQSGERKFRFDADGNVVGVYKAETYFSQTLIEETALAANQAVGDFFKLAGLPTIYRIHPEKDPEEQAEVLKNLEKLGLRVPKKERLTGRDIGQMVRFVRSLPNAASMVPRVMGLLERATYEVADEEDEAAHFGLARRHYLHFTSPIRRYPDLVVHRMLFDALTGGESALSALREGEWVRELVVVAGHASTQAEVAEMAETAIGDLKLCQLMEPRIGEEFEAVVGRVNRGGFEVDLTQDYIRGYLPARTIGSQTILEGTTLKIRTRRGTRVFREGDRIRVRVQDVDFVRLKIFFELAG